MSAVPNTFENVKAVILSAHKGTTSKEKVDFYNSWAENYDQLKNHGFGHFVGVDGSEAMLEVARESGLYQDLKQVLLGEDPLPVQWENAFDVVVIVGALSVGQVPVCVVRDLCKSTKPGGYVCMTTRSNRDNLEYKASLDSELRQMEEEGLWTCVEVTQVKDWEKAVSEHEDGYISGAVYLYEKLQV
ncbi:methyltransferase-like protein 27 isoform X2 [Amphiprion ocellaris]|uniref:methyltransferase-like protein 27 isoform X2 n=1 Tax=Amphiprion ocellaris TaxID=80972 RepID=UPI0024115A0C|nr:methyltransferase-like protein 27 isoform X2 [Amphiprion ocellaris]XP_054872939.1 methyltransferase-like protein 27 isoform X2 [Amphiprion ocellaris]